MRITHLALLAAICMTASLSFVPGAAAQEAAGSRVSAAGISFQLPAGWQKETPQSSMRAAQASIPGGGTLVVFFFGEGGGGGVEPNIQRWIDQMDSEGQPERKSFESGEFTIHWVSVTGTLKPSMMGTGPAEAQPGSQLIGAVVEAPGGPWFFKATGPQETLQAQSADIMNLLNGLQRE